MELNAKQNKELPSFYFLKDSTVNFSYYIADSFDWFVSIIDFFCCASHPTLLQTLFIAGNIHFEFHSSKFRTKLTFIHVLWTTSKALSVSNSIPWQSTGITLWSSEWGWSLGGQVCGRLGWTVWGKPRHQNIWVWGQRGRRRTSISGKFTRFIFVLSYCPDKVFLGILPKSLSLDKCKSKVKKCCTAQE